MLESETTAPAASDFAEVGLEIDEALKGPLLHFAALLKRVEGRNYGSLEENQRIATLIQQTADRLCVAFSCTRCGAPARLRCSQAPTAKTGMFTFSHNRHTHGGGTSVPVLQITTPVKDARKVDPPDA